MTQPNSILLGAVAGSTLVWLLCRLPADRRAALYGVGLVVAVVVYVAFAVVAGVGLAQELGGGLIFAAVALAGIRGHTGALAAGWAAHVWWDVTMHGVASPIAPPWYPAFCVGFDLLVAGAIVGELALRPSTPQNRP